MFQKAERKKAKLRLALCAPSGAGKTYSAILIAQGLGGKIAMIDTENGSGEMYAHLCDYDVCRVEAPFTVKKYVDAIKFAEKAGYSTIIIDSLSHAWSAEGGLLEQVDNAAAASSSKNSYHAWRNVTPEHNRLINAMLQSSCHIIATMRSKTAYDTVKNDRGKLMPVKVGLAPVQRDGLEYEFTVVLNIDADSHVALSSKDRTGLFDGKAFKVTAETGEELGRWLSEGVDAPKPREIENPMSDAQRKKLMAFYSHAKTSDTGRMRHASIKLGREITSFKQLSIEDASILIEAWENHLKGEQAHA